MSILLDPAFAKLVEDLLVQYHLPGISVAVVDNGKVYSKGFGLARYPDIPATPDTLYFAGSTTKSILAATIGKAIHEQDKVKFKLEGNKPLSWSTPLKMVLGKDFVLQDHCASENVTIEDALSHRSGLSGNDNMYGPYIGDEVSAITKRLKYLGPLTQPFRTSWQYNNAMYAVAGDVLERVSGLRCGDAIKEWIWRPLGMKRSFWHLKEIFDNPDVSVEKQMSRGYFWVDNSAESEGSTQDPGYFIPERFLDFASVAPAGATLSSVNDYAKYITALLEAASQNKPSAGVSKGSYTDKKEKPSHITPELFKELTTPRAIVPIPDAVLNSQLNPFLYGLGWEIDSSTLGSLHPIVNHGGGLNGYGTTLYILPNDDFGAVTMGNSSLTGSLVGTLICTELIASRMDLKQRDKEAEYKLLRKSMTAGMSLKEEEGETMKNAMSENAEKATAEGKEKSLNPNDFVSGVNATGTETSSGLRVYEGIYRNPAYGEFRVSVTRAPTGTDIIGSQEQTRRVIYPSRIDKAKAKIQDQIRSKCGSLQVDSVGQRTWKFSYLLHARQASTETRKGLRDFDQEYLFGHGFTDEDVVTGIPTGAEDEGKSDGICRKENAWESFAWTQFGAAFIVDKNDDKIKLGLSCANQLLEKDGDREEGWEDYLTWFDKIASKS